MKYAIPILLILAVLISSCAVQQPTSPTVNPSENKTEDIVKPIIPENKTIPEKEGIKETKPQEPSDEEACINAGGSWFSFSKQQKSKLKPKNIRPRPNKNRVIPKMRVCRVSTSPQATRS